MKPDPEIIRHMQQCDQSRQELRDDLKELPPQLLFAAFYRAKEMQANLFDPVAVVVATVAMAHISDVLGDMYVEGKLPNNGTETE